MESLNHRLTQRSQWAVYQQLEQIPETVDNPADGANPVISGLNLLWRPFLALLIDELIEEQRVEYLDRCWSLNEFGQGERSSSSSLQRLWVLMN